MKKGNGPLDWLKHVLIDKPKENSTKNKNSKIYYVLILVLLGTALMIISDLWKAGRGDETTEAMKSVETEEMDTEAFGRSKSQEDGMKALEEEYEKELKAALDQIVGVYDVTVIVNVEATEKKVLEKNETFKNQTTVEEDKEGGTRKIEDQSTEGQLVLVKEGDKEVPIILERRKPEIKGVLVVAGGAENIQIKTWIVEAVTRGLDVPSHKVAVMPKKSKGDS